MKKIRIDQPVFIAGLPRTGTTLLYSTLCKHRDMAYFCSAWKKKIPLGIFKRLKGEPRPLEGWIWHVANELEHLTESDVTLQLKEKIDNEIQSCLNYWKKKKFINKNPSHSLRTRWLSTLYPDCKFIIITRDDQPTVRSLYDYMQKNWERDYTYKYQDPEFHGWHTVFLRFRSNKDKKSLQKLGSVINYLKYWKKNLFRDLDYISNKRKYFITYEDFVEDPRKKSEEMIEFSGLDWYSKIKIPNMFENMNEKHLKNFDAKTLNFIKNRLND